MKHQYKLLSILLACGLMTACSSDETGLLSTPVPAQFSAQIGDVATRASGTSWTSGDRIGISDNSGAFTNVPYTTAGDGVFTPAGTDRFFYNSTDPVTFTAYYPFNSDGGIITASVADQSKQPEFDFLWAQATGNCTDPDVRFNFRHCMSRLSLTFTNIGNVDLSDLKFTIGGLALEGTFDVATGEAAVSADAVAAELSLTPTEATADRAVSSVILFPQTASDATITITAAGSEFISALPITDFRPGTNYRLAVKVSATGIEVNELNSSEWTDGGSEYVWVAKYKTDLSKANVGDLITASGLLIDGHGAENLSDATKKEVVGVVFWTRNGSGVRNLLRDDKIMADEHPECTHGLAVAVKALTYEGSKYMVWQPESACESVAKWMKSSDFIRNHKGHFVSLASGTGSTENSNKIYGYQNTIALRAYNEYCLKTPGKENYIVRPVAALDQFVADNSCPAPSNSTGWFLPSVKELYTLAAYKDVDNIFEYYQPEPNKAVDSAIGDVGGDRIFEHMGGTTHYLSTMEYESTTDYIGKRIFTVSLLTIYASTNYKYLKGGFQARAVCAF